MAIANPPELRILPAPSGVRADSERVSQVVTAALEPWLEILAIADDVLAAADRIVLAAMAGSRNAVINEAQRLSSRVGGCRLEARDRIAGIEPAGGAA